MNSEIFIGYLVEKRIHFSSPACVVGRTKQDDLLRGVRKMSLYNIYIYFSLGILNTLSVVNIVMSHFYRIPLSKRTLYILSTSDNVR